ncbi:PREDICTED: F-box protein At5g18160-like [Camelina sativa]|uniref:F-box protein At5g18160-like n=1 Tax=Camelina sativa TaxID=90675 RepID=A0ABM0TCF5_CAMSA|nr:PREDICTED: F-box protein At5g18160-like [Camelina sativa]
MDEQEEKQRTTQSSSISKTRSSHRNHKSQSNSIPLDITVEILSRLPAKSIVRSRSVCKLWSFVTTTPEFIRARSKKTSPPCVLLVFRKHDKLIVFSSPQHKDTYSHVEDCQITTPKNGFIRGFDFVHGLICMEGSKRLEIWNPTMKRFFTLPDPQGTGDGYYVGGFLGYEPIGGKYKALCIVRGCNTQVLTLGARESWRVITKGSPIHWPAKDCGRCINGVIYYKAICMPYRHALVSFDLRSESFGLIEFPMRDYVRFLMVSYEGRLALISSIGSVVELWSLEDSENLKYWSCKQFLFSLPANKRFKSLDLKGVTDAGELIYTGMSLNGSFCVVYFDPKKDSIRETKFAAGNEIWQPDRLGFDLVNDFYVLPNHIESFISL